MSDITPFDSASNVTSSTKRSAKSEVWEHFKLLMMIKQRQFVTIAQSTRTGIPTTKEELPIHESLALSAQA
jgi:hypothetical protein